MKYLRKIVALLCALVLIVALVIGFGVIFAVKNVNVDIMSYSYEDGGEQAEAAISFYKSKILADCKGRLMLSVGEDSVKNDVESNEDANGNTYVLVSCEKQYPCTLNVTIRERRETFIRAISDDVHEIYDENGEFMRIADEDNLMNKLDGAPDIVIEGIDTRARVKEVASICAIFSREFSALRSVVERVSVLEAVSQYDYDRIVFYLRCGLQVELREYSTLTEQKMQAAAARFEKLNGDQKLRGGIYVMVDSEGIIKAVYTPNLSES